MQLVRVQPSTPPPFLGCGISDNRAVDHCRTGSAASEIARRIPDKRAVVQRAVTDATHGVHVIIRNDRAGIQRAELRSARGAVPDTIKIVAQYTVHQRAAIRATGSLYRRVPAQKTI